MVRLRDEPLERLYSQSCYFVLWAEKSLMDGNRGKFTVLDARSHRLARVCRSTFAAELLGAEESFDVGQFVRGHLAAVMGYPLMCRNVDSSADAIGPLWSRMRRMSMTKGPVILQAMGPRKAWLSP